VLFIGIGVGMGAPPQPPLICFLDFLCLRLLRIPLFLVLPKIFKKENIDFLLLDFAILYKLPIFYFIKQLNYLCLYYQYFHFYCYLHFGRYFLFHYCFHVRYYLIHILCFSMFLLVFC